MRERRIPPAKQTVSEGGSIEHVESRNGGRWKQLVRVGQVLENKAET